MKRYIILYDSMIKQVDEPSADDYKNSTDGDMLIVDTKLGKIHDYTTIDKAHHWKDIPDEFEF